MMKSIMAFVGSSALAIAPVPTSAQALLGHVYSVNTAASLEGYVSFGAVLCYVHLNLYLNDTDYPSSHPYYNNYNNVYDIFGYTALGSPDPSCPYITIYSGYGEVTGSKSINVNMYISYGAHSCITGPIEMIFSNIDHNAQIDQNTSCGYIVGDLYGPFLEIG